MQLLESELMPDSFLPAQLYDTPGGARIQPEKRLQVAVLADAILTFHRWAGEERSRKRRLFMEAEAWFASDAADGPFAFITICDSLTLDPSYLRRGLRQWCAHLEVAAKKQGSLHRDPNGTRHQVVLPRLRRVA